MSGVGFLATMKTFAPSIRRRRRIDDKKNLELCNNSGENAAGCNGRNNDENLTTHDVPPITPPAAFLPPGYKRLSMKGKLHNLQLDCIV